jgi:hypothetical protein
MQWKLNANFSILNQEQGAEIELKNVDIICMHAYVHRLILAEKKLTYMSFMDSIQELDHFVLNRVTNDSINVGTMATADSAACMPQGNMATIAAIVACVSLLPVAVILGAVNGKERD